MSHEIMMLPPEHCRGCKWTPVKPNNDKQAISVENAWLIVMIPNSVIWFYVCPKCGFVMPNDNAVENVEKLIEARKQKIVTPGQPKLVVPKGVTKTHLN